ncbi:MAG: HupE/UreJ family protein, partial [Candidatus Rokubacteria bacterium]|nr:HupE/UreJ family protein [Candidatus Rokubacteria bacterium]
FVVKARVSFDPGFYKLAEQSALCIEQTRPGSVEALLLRGHVLHAMHRFREGVGLENVLGGAPRRRWLLAFGFGLVHGLGFASALRELGIGAEGGRVVAPLLAFNVGVELGQVGIALLVVPLLERVRRLPWAFPRLVAACSVLVTAAGTYWLVARTLWG